MPQVVLLPVERKNVFSCLQQTLADKEMGGFLSLASTRILATLAVLQPQLCHYCGHTQVLVGIRTSEALPASVSQQGAEQISQF